MDVVTLDDPIGVGTMGERVISAATLSSDSSKKTTHSNSPIQLR
jgi:hypothetical protein